MQQTYGRLATFLSCFKATSYWLFKVEQHYDAGDSGDIHEREREIRGVGEWKRPEEFLFSIRVFFWLLREVPPAEKGLVLPLFTFVSFAFCIPAA